MKTIQMIILCTLMGMLSSYAQTIDKSLNRHDFFYAGEGKRIRMYIVKDGRSCASGTSVWNCRDFKR